MELLSRNKRLWIFCLSFIVFSFGVFHNVAIAQDHMFWSLEVVDGSVIVGDTSLSIDSKGNPHIVYYNIAGDSDDVKYAYFHGKNWNTESVFTNIGSCSGVSIAVDEDDYPHIIVSIPKNCLLRL